MVGLQGMPRQPRVVVAEDEAVVVAVVVANAQPGVAGEAGVAREQPAPQGWWS